jgi:hypothetical protein
LLAVGVQVFIAKQGDQFTVISDQFTGKDPERHAMVGQPFSGLEAIESL